MWVINYIIYKSDNFLANSKKWIAEKLLGFFIMVIIGCGLTTFKDIPLLLQGISIILGFVILRFVSFRQLDKISSYELSKATALDYEPIFKINNSHLEPSGKESFLISKLDLNSIEEKIKQNHSFYTLKVKQEKEVIGFIELSDSATNDVLDKVDWKSADKKEHFLSPERNLKYIERVAIHKDYKKKGIGTAIYKNLFSQLHDYSFYSFVMTAPYNNLGSKKFHDKMKFKIVGTFNSSEYAGFKNYRSELYYIDNK